MADGPLSNRAAIATLPSTEATASPKPSPGVGVANVTGGVNEPGTKTGGTSLTMIVAMAVLRPAEAVVDGQRDGDRCPTDLIACGWRVGPVAVPPSPNDQE